MRLRAEQLVSIRQSGDREMAARFARNVAAGAPEFAPIHGDRATREAIREAIVRARSLGFEVEGDIERYVLASLILGADFAADPQIPWAARALARDGSSPSRRAARLFDRTTHFASRVFGPRREHLRAALGAMDRALPSGHDGGSLLAFAERLYPRKLEVIGHDAFLALAAAAPEAARAVGLSTSRGASALVGLQFMIGANVARDPRVPWAGEILRDPSVAREADRIDLLLTAAWDYAERWRRAITLDFSPEEGE